MASKDLEAEQESIDTRSQAKVVLKDPFIGNVSKLVPLPVDHKSPPMRGHLLFEHASREVILNPLPRQQSIPKQTTSSLRCAGNLGRVDYISDYVYDVFIRPDKAIDNVVYKPLP